MGKITKGIAFVVIFGFPSLLFAFQPLFETWISYDVGFSPVWVVASDLDLDGDQDLAAVGRGKVSVLKNNGDGTFAPGVDYLIEYAGLVFAADLDGDGDLDLAVVNALSNSISVLKNNGDGTFTDRVDYGTGWLPMSAFASDLDGDGDIDLVTANYLYGYVSILKNLIISVLCSALPGDANGDDKVNLADIIYKVNYIFKGGSAPSPFCRGDANVDGKVNLTDIIYAVNYIFKGGPAPLPIGVCCL